MPLRRKINPFKAIPPVKPFEMDEFLSNLGRTGPLLTSGIKGDWDGLYRRFLRSPNFECWLQTRLEDMELQLSNVHLDVLCNAALTVEEVRSRHQVEVVDLVLKLKERMEESRERGDRERTARLESQLGTVLNAVDEDLKLILLSNGEFRDMFQSGFNCK